MNKAFIVVCCFSLCISLSACGSQTTDVPKVESSHSSEEFLPAESTAKDIYNSEKLYGSSTNSDGIPYHFIIAENEGTLFRFEIYNARLESEYNYCLLTIYKDEDIIETAKFPKLGVNEVFGYSQETNEFGENVGVSFANENMDIFIFCPDSQATIVLDRKTATGFVKYDIDADQIKKGDYSISSSDNRYTIYRGAGTGGGDYWASQQILYDSVTDEYKYICTLGGMYGGGESIGFFKNNDIYVFGLTEFLIYEKGMPNKEPKFVLSQNFPLGKVEDGDTTHRYLFAARRNPESFDYTVIYADFTHQAYIDELCIDEDGFVLAPTYKIGILDTDGKLVDYIDTGLNVRRSPFGLSPVDMRKRNENTIYFSVKYKSSVITEAETYLDTGITSVISEQEWTPKT